MSLFPRLPKKFWWQKAHDELTQNLPLSGAGTPTATATVPKSIGQIYVDTSANKAYIAKGITSVSDWMLLN